jgi:formylglycine-generating enzyme required for sulfatase activity
MAIAAALLLNSACSSLPGDLPRNLADGAVFADCSDCPEMVVIPPGSFVMGHEGGVNEERYEGPPHPVTIRSRFALGRLEISNAQFARFVGATGYRPGTDCRIWTGDTVQAVTGQDWRDPGYGRPPRDDEPVACVSWHDASAYVAWLATITGQPYRLPSEAEWEYVAHGGGQSTYSWGEDPDGGCEVANYYDQSARGLRPWQPVACDDGQRIVGPVGSLAPNAFGIHDIIGNVWEWTQDCYLVPYGPQPTDGRAYEPGGACERRVVRGGAWHSPATWQRPTFRGRDTEDFVTQVFGIRVARDMRDP